MQLDSSPNVFGFIFLKTMTKIIFFVLYCFFLCGRYKHFEYGVTKGIQCCSSVHKTTGNIRQQDLAQGAAGKSSVQTGAGVPS